MKKMFMIVLCSVISTIGAPVHSNLSGKHSTFVTTEGGNEYTAADYVQDGLISLWDGIENIGFGAHDNSAQVWIDLIGEQDIILSQYGKFSDDSLVCAGGGFAASREILFKPFVYAEVLVEYFSLERQNGNIVIWGEYEGFNHYAYSGDFIIYSDILIQISGQTLFYSKEASEKFFLLQYVRDGQNFSDLFALLNGKQLDRYTKQDNWATRYGIGYFGGRKSGYSYRGKIKRIAMYSRVLTPF